MGYYNMSHPAEHAIAMDRRAAGICPTVGMLKPLRALREQRARQLTHEQLATEAEAPEICLTVGMSEPIRALREQRACRLTRERLAAAARRRSVRYRQSLLPRPKPEKTYLDPQLVFDRNRKSENDTFLLSKRKRKAEEVKNEEGSQKQGGRRGRKAGNLPVPQLRSFQYNSLMAPTRTKKFSDPPPSPPSPKNPLTPPPTPKKPSRPKKIKWYLDQRGHMSQSRQDLRHIPIQKLTLPAYLAMQQRSSGPILANITRIASWSLPLTTITPTGLVSQKPECSYNEISPVDLRMYHSLACLHLDTNPVIHSMRDTEIQYDAGNSKLIAQDTVNDRARRREKGGSAGAGPGPMSRLMCSFLSYPKYFLFYTYTHLDLSSARLRTVSPQEFPPSSGAATFTFWCGDFSRQGFTGTEYSPISNTFKMLQVPFRNVPDQKKPRCSTLALPFSAVTLAEGFTGTEMHPTFLWLNCLNGCDLGDPRVHLAKRPVGPTGTWSITLMAPTKTRRASSSLTETDKAQRKRLSDALYYQQHAATIREKRRVQMAEKRALKKASRRKSDKPRPTKKSVKPRATKAVSQSAAGSCNSPPDDSDSECLTERTMRDAEREATETLAGMWRPRSSRSPGPHELNRNADALDPFQHWQDTVRVEDVNSSSDDEPASGLQYISEVAGHPTPDITRPKTPVQPPHGPIWCAFSADPAILVSFIHPNKQPPTQRALHSVVEPKCEPGPFNANAEFDGLRGCVGRETPSGEGTS
ncbi:hypothetical protein B0H14DRAFT_2583391 [Mycena olivaceomarginata]|nr:hypothetical protein B0H14DRAFT_2583391 [Mycena olivaceomarginata]